MSPGPGVLKWLYRLGWPLCQCRLWWLHRSEMSVGISVPWVIILSLHTRPLRRLRVRISHWGLFHQSTKKNNRLPCLFPGDCAPFFWALFHEGAVLPVTCFRLCLWLPSPSCVRTQTVDLCPSIDSHLFISRYPSAFKTPQRTLASVVFLLSSDSPFCILSSFFCFSIFF